MTDLSLIPTEDAARGWQLAFLLNDVPWQIRETLTDAELVRWLRAAGYSPSATATMLRDLAQRIERAVEAS